MAACAANLHAVEYNFVPTAGSSLWNLDHSKYHVWAIEWSMDQGEVLDSATLTFKNIWNCDDEENILRIFLLNNIPTSYGLSNVKTSIPFPYPQRVFEFEDTHPDDTIGQLISDGVLQGGPVGTWSDPDGPATMSDITFSLPLSQLSSYLGDDHATVFNFGLGN